MSRPQRSLFFFLFSLVSLFHFSRADVGTCAFYDPPYLPTACNGNNPDQFPAGNLFAAAGEGIWDNGAACGRMYLVRCLSSAPSACIPGQTVQVKIVDKASQSRTTMVLSSAAFKQIANPSTGVKDINIEFRQV